MEKEHPNPSTKNPFLQRLEALEAQNADLAKKNAELTQRMANVDAKILEMDNQLKRTTEVLTKMGHKG